MGVDWCRMRLKPGVDADVARQLIEEQANAFQSMSHYWSIEGDRFDCEDVRYSLERALHEKKYIAACNAFCELIEWPVPPENDVAFPLRQGIYSVAENPIYPLLWRLDAHRSYLAEHLESQLKQWKRWAEEVAAGKHERYLRELHRFVTSDFMIWHFRALRGQWQPFSTPQFFRTTRAKFFTPVVRVEYSPGFRRISLSVLGPPCRSLVPKNPPSTAVNCGPEIALRKAP